MLKIVLPFVDLRGKTPIDLLRAYPDRALSLVQAARKRPGALAGALSVPVTMLTDRLSHHWFRRTHNPYLYEIETFADVVESCGIYTLNLHYDWSCTTGVYRGAGGVSMLRVQDSSIAGMGSHVMLALQQGSAGVFYNVTWPGLSGVFSAMAPGRFVAAINKAPLKRHTRSAFADRLLNQLALNRQDALPPSHLLRQVMEHAPNYQSAKHMLSHVPLAMPAIFTLSGVRPGEGCVIERLEDRFEVIELGAAQRVCASNHFCSPIEMEFEWRNQAEDSFGRLRLATTLYAHDLEIPDFDWIQAPLINPDTRMCMVADAGSGRFMVQGYEGVRSVTELLGMQPPEYSMQTEEMYEHETA